MLVVWLLFGDKTGNFIGKMLIRILVVGRNVRAPQQTTYSMIGMCDNHVTSLSFQKNSQKIQKFWTKIL
jgi:hypothetical protein